MTSNSEFPQNILAAHQHLLHERLSSLLAELNPILRDDVARAFRESGKLLSPSDTQSVTVQPTLPAGVWSLLTLLVAQYVSPDIEPLFASSVAISTECF